ncbi:MAG: GDP-mannose 4,6-dehydratase [Pirellulaceae bacterium]|nr:GDP-mannose 4,6-dehydratase [Pirellulaceae bacterium]
MSPIAIITGITGQDGSYLTELLVSKGYIVHGIVRQTGVLTPPRLAHLIREPDIYESQLFLHYADLNDAMTIRRIVHQVAPNEFYHLAGQSHVGLSFDIPESTCELTAMGTLRILEILRELENPPRMLHASSREIFGTPPYIPQTETTPLDPSTPYGCAKAFATQLVKTYRNCEGLFCCNAICYNHESPRRGENFVTRKITIAAARIAAGLQENVGLGDLSAARDWGFAGDYVEAMWRMLQQDAPSDYVLATGESHSVTDWLDIAFSRAGLQWKDHVETDNSMFRSTDPCMLLGNPQKAENELGWKRTVDFEELVDLMFDADQERVFQELEKTS